MTAATTINERNGMKNMAVRIEFDGIVLRSYKHGWEIGKPVMEKDERTGEMKEKLQGAVFPSSLPSALRTLLEMKMRASGATSLDELRLVIDEFSADVQAILPEHLRKEKSGGK